VSEPSDSLPKLTPQMKKKSPSLNSCGRIDSMWTIPFGSCVWIDEKTFSCGSQPTFGGTGISLPSS
jgi:hypothetical protein